MNVYWLRIVDSIMDFDCWLRHCLWLIVAAGTDRMELVDFVELLDLGLGFVE